MRTLKSTTVSTVVVVDSASAPEAAVAMQRSPWHSPVPYLFGGLAAMLGLIAFALLILACSYWKLSGQLNGGDSGEDLDDEMKKGDVKGKGRVVYEEQFVVIMAGDDKPTCLAMPVCNRRGEMFSYESDGKNGSSCDDVKVDVGRNDKGELGEGDGEQMSSDGEESNFNMNSEQSQQVQLQQHQTQLDPGSSGSS